MTTGQADEAARPSQPFQVVQAVCISREPSPKLPKRLRVVDAGMGTFHCPSLAQLRLNGYPRTQLSRVVEFAERQRATKRPVAGMPRADGHHRPHRDADSRAVAWRCLSEM